MKQKSLLLTLFMLLGFSMANAKFEQLPKGKALASRPGISLPADVALGNAANFATIDKNGIGKRLKARRKAAEPVFSDDFESGNLDQWTIYTMGESPTANGWTLASNCGGYTAHSGTYYACSKSWTQGTGQGQIFSADNWLVTPLVSLGGKLSFWDKSDPEWPDQYEVLLSTTSNAISDFTTTLRPMQDANGEWTEVEVDLSAYKGQGYIAIHHVSSDKFHLHIDDFCVYPSEGKDFDVADLVGDYIWDYKTSSELATDLSSVTTTAGQARVKIALSEKTEGGITISGMFPNDLEATVESDGSYFVIEQGQVAGTYSSNSDYVLKGLFYYEGDENYEAGWYYSDIYGDIADDGSIHFDDWICRVLSGGENDGYSLTPYYVAGSTLTPTEPLIVVTLPEGLEILPYAMIYDEGSKGINVAVDGNDVYFQGMSQYLPEAWVKGTKEGNLVTFPAMQYMGDYGSNGSSFFFYNGEATFTYDPDAGTYTAEGLVFGVLADQYYDGKYTNPVLSPVVEKAAMPADPKVTGMEETSYGWIVEFNIPLADVNGEPMVVSKLSYIIYTDTKGAIVPLTFTSATHTRLTEDMTEIPYGFTENYDFYTDVIYLNDLYSADWTRIGIQSIYRGGGEENKTEIQWFDILPEPEAIEAPEGLVTEAYALNAYEQESEGAYTHQMQVGFDGNDVYFKGVSDDTADMWLKGTLSADGKTVTIPANQYMGLEDLYGIVTYKYFFSALGEDNETLEDIVLNYNAELGTFTTDQTLVLHDGKRSLGEPYQVFTNVVITKMLEFATPADPEITNYDFTGAWPLLKFYIPTEDVNGNALQTSKLFYTVWEETGGEEIPFVVRASEYRDVTEDMVEIPYDYYDNFDIYFGGSTFYINPTDEPAYCSKFGVQSIYYSGGERRTSNIVWVDNSVYDPTGIWSLHDGRGAADDVIYNLSGQRLSKAQKGINIVRGKKVLVK